MKTSMKKNNIKGFIFILIIILLVAVYGGYKSFSALKLPVDKNNNDSIIITVPKGATTSKIANILKAKDLIRNELYFRFISKQRKIEAQYKAGDYKLNKAMDIDEIISNLIDGKTYKETVKFTIPEGFEIKQIVDRLANDERLNINKDKLIDVIENEDFDYKFLNGVDKGKNRLEGFLFPDTYEVNKAITEKELITKMLNRFDQIFNEEYYKRVKELNMSVNDVITLASIIEREAKVNEERSIVSSVFHNRLKKDMLLQSCATVQYVLGERKEKLTYKDLKIESPYNTYKYSGLPPMPIASPGKASIEAALYPKSTNYLYFVAKGDGSHVFSKTYNDHIRAKNEVN